MNAADVMQWLTPEERDQILAIDAAPVPLWTPSPGPQTMAYRSKADVIGYGCAAANT